MHEPLYKPDVSERRSPSGVILLITLVILVILSTLGYTLTVRVAARRHRDQYHIDYSIARHACASGMRYALSSLGSLEFPLISRPNEPDFSDVFAMSEPEYQRLLDQMELYLAQKRLEDPNFQEDATKEETTKSRKKPRLADTNDINDMDADAALWARTANVQIPGPYGPPWPLVTRPVEFEIGAAKVKIEIEDENAKYPLSWTLLEDQKLQEEAGVSWATFCEWMGYTSQEMADLNRDLAKMVSVKPFKLEFKPETTRVAPPVAVRTRIVRPTPSRTAPAAARRTVTKTLTPAQQMEQQNQEFARLFHSSMLNRALLTRQSIESDSRHESAMRYLGLWATRHVNVNTAPRHVLEAALTFGSAMNAPKIAEGIIQLRKAKPVTDVNDLKRALIGHSDSIEECRDFITVASTVFTIRVTATCGVARATAMAAVSKEGDKVQQIAVVGD